MKRSSNKAKDIDWQIAGAENPELNAMATIMKIWPAPTTKLKHLKRLHEKHLLPEQRLGRWRLENIGSPRSDPVRLFCSSLLLSMDFVFLLVLSSMVSCIIMT
jgi:hypothetical protein